MAGGMIESGTQRGASLDGRILQLALKEGLLTPEDVERLSASALAGDSELDAAPSARSSKRDNQRYERGELLGEGGMGQVYRAYDTALKRPVALKFLRSDDPERIARFLREAQAQARVDHGNVCKVYEAGELDGRPYIAMQLIQGQPLFVTEGEAAHPSPPLDQMSVEQKVRILRDVAEAIHAAHREGLIHRDIKPANIMLEQGEDGSFKPYVLDFGLAREVASAGVTSLGLAAGTPNFMAPEQARGDAASLDRRTDVYGLGATLYALLSGHPPFEGPSSLDVLLKVTEEEARPLTSVPEDLATIVAKCLQKEPSQRYDSARALAADLDRYLDGEPVRARRTSLSYRLLKKARKHRRLVAAGGVAGLAFLVLGAASLRAQLHAQERARLAGVFGQEVKAIESRMRIAHLAPEHDIRPEKAAIRQRMAAIDTQTVAIGGLAEGPAHYALGRGHLALQELDLARRDLEQAWKAGYREPEVAYALGQVMGILYQQALEVANRIRYPARRDEKRAQAQRDYRDPALAYLQQSQGLDVEAPEYVEALVAFYEKRYPEAIAKARAASTRLPWFHEARGLEGQVLLSVASDQATHRQPEASMESFGSAEAAFRAAMEVGRSDPSLPKSLCGLFWRRMNLELNGQNRSVDEYFEKGLAACDRALRVDPDDSATHIVKAYLLERMAESESRRGRDGSEMLARSLTAAREAVRLGPDKAEAYGVLGRAFGARFAWQSRHGIDDLSALHEAMAALDKGLALDPTSSSLVNIQGGNYLDLAIYLSRRGEDPTAMLHKAEQLYLAATDLPPGYKEFNAHNAEDLVADWQIEHGEDPRAALDKAFAAARAAVDMDPSNILLLAAAADVCMRRAEFARLTGEDPRPSVEQSIEFTKAALAINPEHDSSNRQMVVLTTLLARWAAATGDDPRPRLEEAWRWASKMRQFDHDAGARVIEARLALFEGEWRRSQGLPATASLVQALRVAPTAAAVETESKDLAAWTVVARAHLRLAQDQRGSRREAFAHISSGLAAAEKVLTVNPHHAAALAVRGALYREQGQNRQARESLEQALEINRFLSREYGALIEQVRREGP
jgi:serine/threonine-protein kinase